RVGRRRVAPGTPRGAARDPRRRDVPVAPPARNETALYRPSVRSTPAFLLAAAAALPALAQSSKPPPEVPETPIEIPDPTPVGLLVAWKPSLLSVRLDTGKGSQFGSDKLQPLRFLGRYTAQFAPTKPYFGRIELEGG